MQMPHWSDLARWAEGSTAQYVPLPHDSDTDEVESGLLSNEKKLPSATARGSITNKILKIFLALLQQLWTATRPAILSPHGKRKLHPTSWLDGVRGLAAFFVFLSHGIDVRWAIYRGGWTHGGFFLRMPIFRIFYSGPGMVSVFFIVSGYAISYKPLLLARAREHSKVFDCLVSSTFRRGIRLYFPCAAFVVIGALIKYCHLEYRPKKTDPRAESLLSTIWWMVQVVVPGMNPLTLDRRWMNSPFKDFEPVMWTIPVEFRGSVCVFVLILVVAKASRAMRLGALIASLTYLTCVGQWDIFLFVMGTLACEIHHRRQLPRHDEHETRSANVVSRVVRAIGVLLALLPITFLLSQPETMWKNGDVWVYDWLAERTPAAWQKNMEAGSIWRVIAATSLIFLVEYSMILQKFFVSRPIQYLGDVSFMLYLLHPWLLSTIGKRLVHVIFPLTDKLGWGMISESLGVLILLVCFMPILFWGSEIATKFIDRTGVDFARWAEDRFYGVQRPNGPPKAS
ncbi:hypothetical protein RBB50_000712 [Rhinocladiella similis]